MILSVIGTGNMGKALISGLLHKGALPAESLLLYDIDQDKAKELAASVGAYACSNLKEAFGRADTILLAVKPQVVDEVFAGCDPLRPTQLLISIAAGVTLAKLRRLAGPDVAIARVMPNTPALVGAGVSAIAFDQADEEQQAQVKSFMGACGRVYVVPEKALDAVTGLSGSGPAYIMLVIEALADGAVRQGLSREMALEMAAMTVYGSAKLILDTNQHPAVLKDQVCSPGGTTIEGVACLERDGLRSAFIEAVAAATEKSRQMKMEKDHA